MKPPAGAVKAEKLNEGLPAGPDHVVAIGGSAGGLEALQALASQLQPGGNVAYLVAQRLSPDHPSQLVELLARSTQLKVVGAHDGSPIYPDQLLVIPPNSDATVNGSKLKLTDPEPRFGPSPSIDLLFESLATHWGEQAAAVVLSGTGSDGARGLRAVGAVGGLTLVQSPESARFDGMPRAAIALGGSDLVADAATLGIRLSHWFNHKGACPASSHLGRLASMKLAGEGTCLPPGCRRRQPGGGDTKTEPPHFQKPYQYWSGVIGIGRQPGPRPQQWCNSPGTPTPA